MSTTISKTRAMVECALLIAVATVLAQIKIFEMPYGGSITLFSMLPLVVISFRHGLRWGLLAGFVNSLLQMLMGFYAPPAGTIGAVAGMVLLDYLLAFMVFGTAVLIAAPFKHKLLGVGVATAAVCFGRFLCSFLSGILLWSSYQSYYEWAEGMPVWLYSLIYNGSYMLPELLLTTIGAIVLCKAMPSFFSTTLAPQRG